MRAHSLTDADATSSRVFSSISCTHSNDAPVSSRPREPRLAAGARAGSFVIERFLAQGGFGQVYVATHATSGRRAAIKVLHPDLEVQDRVVARFVREVEVLRRLHHPNIVEVLEIGTTEDGGPFYAMEYLEGTSLATLLSQQGGLSLDATLSILEPVCSALATAHAAGVVHRDVKASNIVLLDGSPPQIKLLDFGIAKLLDTETDSSSGLTSIGKVVGTLSVMAPEQILGGPIDERVDIYALGALLFRMVTGRQPFSSLHSLGLVEQLLQTPAPKPSDFTRLPAEIDVIVLRCLEKAPARRFPSVADFMSALRTAVAVDARSEEEEPGLEARALGVGLHVGLHVDEHVDSIDGALAHDISQILALAEAVMQRDGFTLLSTNETEVFGVRRLPEAPAEAASASEQCPALVQELQQALAQRPGADSRLQVTVRTHLDELLLSADAEPEILGGKLTEVRLWPSPRAEAGSEELSSRMA